MIETLNKLLQLQQLDTELSILENKSKDIPRRIEGIKLVLENKKTEQNTLHQNLIDSKKKYKLLEVDLKETEDKINQYSTQLYAAKTNDQYKAFLKEIETQKKTKSHIEDSLIDALESIETTERTIKHLETEVIEIAKETNDKIEILKKEEANLHNAMKERITTRGTICQELGKDTLAIYERIRKNKGGIAVAVVEGERCGGCLNPLPAQKVLEIKKHDRIHFCEYCGRIAVAPDTFNNNQ